MNKLSGEIVIVTGGAGMLGNQYCQAIREINGFPVSLDIKYEKTVAFKEDILEICCDISSESQVMLALQHVKENLPDKPIYGLINNACIDPKFEKDSPNSPNSRLECYPSDFFDWEIAVGLKGAFLCTKHFGAEMASNGRGSIINISSVLGLVAPNQALYKKEGVSENEQPCKPVTYSIIKHGIIGLSKYTATYWAHRGIRCNTLAPGGVYNNHCNEFVEKLLKYIPLAKMAEKSSYNEAIKFLLTDASSYMTGAVLQMDG